MNYILDIPAEEWDLRCASIVFQLATMKAHSQAVSA
jgi:hypothetical protein